ncbi:MAG: peptidase M15, partial [Acidobacteria bacterium]|nr:peptidase M15 [Acidobacteriota bacterium]
DLAKSIVYSVAPPGTSQHLSMLALDVNEHDDLRVRDVLAEHGWFQTVVSDLPHFTFLGVSKNQLSKLGLKKIFDSGRFFWLPNL